MQLSAGVLLVMPSSCPLIETHEMICCVLSLVHIKYNAALRMTMIPVVDLDMGVGFSTWTDAEANYDAFTADVAASLHQLVVHDVPEWDRWWSIPTGHMVVPIALIPRADNSYNPRAISVSRPVGQAGTVFSNYIGYLFETDLSIYADALHRLSKASVSPLGAFARVGFTKSTGEWTVAMITIALPAIDAHTV